MSTISVIGKVDDQHRLVATVPESIAPGPIEILLTVPTRDEDAAGSHWMQGVSQAWHDDLSDERQDIYTLADGVPTDEFHLAAFSFSDTLGTTNPTRP